MKLCTLMRPLRNLSIGTRLLLMILVVAIGAVLVAGYLGLRTGQTALQERLLSQFASTRATKSLAIEQYFTQLQKQVQTLSNDLMLMQATDAFSRAYHQLNARKAAGTYLPQLNWYYTNTYVPALRANVGQADAPLTYVPQSAAARYLQYWYIVVNPNPADQRLKLDVPRDGSDYSKVHALYHRLLRDYMEKFGFSDMMLVDGDTGDVIYTVKKQVDFGTNIDSGPFRDTRLAIAARASHKSAISDFVKIEDFGHYLPAEGAPEAFIASPIIYQGRHVGELVFALSVDVIDRIMTDDRHWKEAGLGETGQSYLVGSDYRMRSNDRWLLENPERYWEMLRAEKVPEATVKRIQRLNTSILQEEVKTPAVEAALQGKSGTVVITRPSGEKVTSSYSPLSIQGLKWVLVTEQDVSETNAPIQAFRKHFRLSTAIIVVLAAGLALLMARVFVKPIRALRDGARRFGEGDRNVEVPVTSNDELGQLTGTFNEMVHSIRHQTEIIEQKNAENERLLRNILPGVIAERLKQGEKSIADGFGEVTVLFADVVGFTAFSSHTPAAELVSLLNDLFSRFDAASQRHSIEKIKTIGDCYMAVCGLPTPRTDHARAMMEMAREMERELAQFNRDRGTNLQLRIGLNSGPVVAGVIGSIKFIYDLWGDAVNLASRMESTGVPGAIQVSESVYRELKDEYSFEERGLIEVKGKGKLPAWILREEGVPSEAAAVKA
ncbi:MAG TPA: adenylate/guanylate cyclase domain-containing protein [Terriglobia bacterium]|nr:adenylate/guanylate cyclase domain-containing protein [Terriglobia bacterium]